MRAHSTSPTLIPASLSAGPVFLLGLAIAFWAAEPTATRSPVMTQELIALPFQALVLCAAAACVGLILAFVPIWIGTKVMTWLSRDNEGMQLPIVWAIVGGLAAGGSAWLALGSDNLAAQGGAIAFGFTGAVCALLSRVSSDFALHRAPG